MDMLMMMAIIVPILISIAFFTLMERKVISYAQNRKGPNKTGKIGIIQPMSDAIKLMNKEINLNYKSNFLMFLISPMMNIMCSLMMWLIFPSFMEYKVMKMSFLFMVCCMSVNTIIIMVMGWSSNSNYSMLGMMRSVSQMISYEVNFMMILIVCMNLSEQMNLEKVQKTLKWSPLMIFMSVMFILWLIISLAETNRTPFDFSEGESELVSGFNVEFGGPSFMMLFLAEYSSILMISFVSSVMFSCFSPKSVEFILLYLSMCFFFIWTRSSLPRFRYDMLMSLNWQQILPATIVMVMMSFMVKMYYTKNYK